MRSGYVNPLKETGRQAFRVAIEYGYTWSSSAIEESDSITAYDLYFVVSDINPSNGPNGRRNGFPLRCLSTTAVGRATKKEGQIIMHLPLLLSYFRLGTSTLARPRRCALVRYTLRCALNERGNQS